MSKHKPLLEVKNLHMWIQSKDSSKQLVQDVSFALPQGEVLGLIGESGAGKSTIARASMGFIPARARTTGGVFFGDVNMLTTSNRQLQSLRGRRVAYIAQDPRSSINPLKRLDIFLTEAMCSVHKVGRSDALRRAKGALESVNLDPELVLSSYPHQLSGGMLQRVVIAAALTTKPDLLIADEPTTALDVTAQAEVIAILKQLVNESGFAMLLVTHNLEIAAAVCNDLLVLRDGRLIEYAGAHQIMREPTQEYTRQLLDATRAVAGALADEVRATSTTG